MEKRRRVGGEGSSQGIEENTMAILDTSGFSSSKIPHHLNDDRLAFLEAVRTASLLPDNGIPPTRKMFEAIFHILRDADSLDLIIESYQLLIELDKLYPRVYLSKGEQSSSSSPKKVPCQLVLVEEAWIPLGDKGEVTNCSKGSIDPLGFQDLIQEISRAAKEMNHKTVETMFLKNMLLLQYLITVLEGDFLPRNSAYQENMDWIYLRESILNNLLGPRRIYKDLAKDCLSVMCDLSQLTASEETNWHDNSSGELPCKMNGAMDLVLPEVKNSTSIALKKLFVLIMELDMSRQNADHKGLTTRADGVRTPFMEIILDELIYDNILCPFLQVFDPKWKLRIIVQYFQKYIPKYSVQTRRSGDPINTQNFSGILKCLSNRNMTKTITKKMSPDVVQLLLAYAFQAYLALSHQLVAEGLSDTMEDVNINSATEVCINLISAFTCLKQEDKGSHMLSSAKEALFAAATILNTTSKGL